MNRPLLAKVAWEGDALDVISGFPLGVKENLGFALYMLQCGQIPPNIRPMTSIASGVFEIKEADETASLQLGRVKERMQREKEDEKCKSHEK